MSRSKANKLNGPPKGAPDVHVPAAPKSEVEKHGISASPGIVIGTAFVRDAERFSVPRSTVEPAGVEGEVQRFTGALAETGRELRVGRWPWPGVEHAA